MTRSIHLFAPLALLVMAAGPSPNTPISLGVTQGLTSDTLTGRVTRKPTPPVDDAATNGFTPAPTPNVDAAAPLPRAELSSQASVGPSLFQPKNQYHGEGYVPGSTVQTEQERKLKFTPGINLRVPLN